ncbi:MAG: hypothetical protein HOP18_27250 [Deltaproteobacteria bacterium]|nr:hypothetical protein [Deltaproteobacteria bacterium]
MMLTAGRNQAGLTDTQIEYCVEVWEILRAGQPIRLDVSEARQNFSCTRFNEGQNTVMLGADAFPGAGVDANSRMSTLACLAHELAHAERFQLGYRRPAELPDVLLDEAETSLRAAFTSLLRKKNREDLVEDARDRLIQWLATHHQEGGIDEKS